MRLVAAVLLTSLAFAHEGGRKNTKPTKAEADLRAAKAKLAEAKKNLQAKGRYACCVKPSCDLCMRRNGSCACAANVAKGLGACGECMAGWQAGRGSIAKVDSNSVRLLTSDKQALPGNGEMSAELKEGLARLLSAKRTLAAEGRFQCCVKGGCGQCAFEADCPCGNDLAKQAGKGVCGDCVDGWHAGEGIFTGVPLSDVTLARMELMTDGMTTGARGGAYVSGTSQTPAVMPMNMLHRRIGAWSVMFHGNLWGVYTNQGGPRGRDKTFAAGWVMPMASRRFAGGTFTFRSMFSIEPLGVTSGRYPLLMQTGETWKNVPIINGQHPHDFVKELGGAYQYKLGESTAINVYAGLRGDPAIGPVAYPHRISASENPIAVIAHHYQDSTHISANVVTMGVTHRGLTLEASGFHGREPDEKRWGIEMGAIDSFASRISFSPSARWSMQYSIGRINNREATHPDRDTFRQTSSIAYVRPHTDGHWATTVIWGRSHDLPYVQKPNGELLAILGSKKSNGRREHVVLVPTPVRGQKYNAYTAESTALFRKKHWVWGRAELTDKDSLLLFEEAPFVRLLEEYRYTRVKAFTAGYSYELPPVGGFLKPAIGGQAQFFRLPENLAPVYGGSPRAMQVWLRFRFAPVR